MKNFEKHTPKEHEDPTPKPTLRGLIALSKKVLDLAEQATKFKKTKSLDRTKREARKQGLWFLAKGSSNYRMTLDKIIKKSRRFKPITEINYNFDRLNDYTDYPYKTPAKLCCALTISTLLNLDKIRGIRIDKVVDLAGALIRGNLQKTDRKDTGVFFGFENAGIGDVLFFRGMGRQTEGLSHVAIIIDRFEIDDAEFIVIRHDEDHLQTDIIPVNPLDNAKAEELEKKLKDPKEKEKLLAQNQSLRTIFGNRGEKFKKTIAFKENKGWFGDATKDRDNNHILFGIKTYRLVKAVEPE